MEHQGTNDPAPPVGELPAMLTVKQFASRSGLTQGTVENLIRTGRLSAYSVKGLRYVPADAIGRLSQVLDRVVPRTKTKDV